MSKRNFILLIIILAVVIIGVFAFLYFSQPTNPPLTDTGGTNFISQFNPFGNSKPATPPVVNPPIENPSSQPSPVPEVNAKLKKVSSMPIAGFIVYSKERLKDVSAIIPTSAPSGTPPGTTVPPPATKTPAKPTPPLTEFAPALRYVERATGNIYQTFADKIQERKFSGTVIPKVYEAYFGNKGESVVMRYLKEGGETIETFVGNLPKEFLGADTTANNEITGSFLPEDIEDVSLSPDASSIFYLFNVGDNLVGTTLNLLNNKKVQVFTSPFTEWLSSWPNIKMLTFTTRPASGIPGYMYSMDPNTKILTEVFGGVGGLTTLTSPNGKLVLYGNDNLSLNVYHLDTKASDLLGVRTLPEKCAWDGASDVIYCAVPKTIDIGAYPDAWYQGEVSFSDQIWKVDLKSGNATMLLDPITVSGGEEVDGIKLAMDAGENYLFFVNKKDSFLWEFNLK